MKERKSRDMKVWKKRENKKKNEIYEWKVEADVKIKEKKIDEKKKRVNRKRRKH